MTLRLRLCVVAGLLLAVLAAAGFLLVQTVESSQLQQLDQQLEASAPLSLIVSRPGPVPGPKIKPPRPFTSDNAVSDIFVATISQGHRRVALAPTLAGKEAPQTPEVVSTLDPKMLRPQTVGSVSGTERWRALLIAEPGTSQRVLLAVSMTRVDATSQRLHLAVLAAGASVLVVLAAAGFWVARLGLRPIVEVTEVADAIAAGDRSRRVRKTRPGTEAAHLARAFNLMLDEQQALEDRLRQFVADASHELRTPVAAIQGFAELWRQGHMREGPPLEDAMRRIGQESSRMAGVVEDLLLLARLDEGHVLERGPVDLAPLVHDAVLDASATHPSRDVRAEGDGPVIAIGDEGALRQVIANLVSNALIHTPANASVTVRATARADAAVLEVTDTGLGMDIESAARAFDRFWRGDRSRTRPGSGLGLPIVAAIVAAHGGELSMESTPGEGTVVRVVLRIGPESRLIRTHSEESSNDLGSR